MTMTADEQRLLLFRLIQTAREQIDGTLHLTDESGAVVADVVAYDLPKRPKDMPRRFRPKQKLSKRQRVAARVAKERKSHV